MRSVAQAGALLILPLVCSGCLALSSPEYEEPRQTPPMLIAKNAFPDLLQPVVVINQEFIEFGGAVLSEDNGAQVHLALYLDYGKPDAIGRPYQARAFPFVPIPPGTLEQGPRTFQGVRWFLSVDDISEGCHTMTMMATHQFEQQNVCPADINDSSFLVWQVLKCDEAIPDCSMTLNCDLQPCPGQDKFCTTCANLPPD